MGATLEELQAAIEAVNVTVGLVKADVEALIAKGSADLGSSVTALSSLNTALTELDEKVKGSLGT